MTSRTCVPVERPANVNPLFLSISSVFFSLSGLSNSRIYYQLDIPSDMTQHSFISWCPALLGYLSRINAVCRCALLHLLVKMCMQSPCHVKRFLSAFSEIWSLFRLQYFKDEINTWELLLRRFRCLCQWLFAENNYFGWFRLRSFSRCWRLIMLSLCIYQKSINNGLIIRKCPAVKSRSYNYRMNCL